ncbi:MCP four helix bundle domain-containing protein, partial [Geomonas sp.]|uniref:MCP four helix bundle domain-containing protein n=1 Tax=Geomonas sp. TaxID=2651584 RepID=UPI002B48B156
MKKNDLNRRLKFSFGVVFAMLLLVGGTGYWGIHTLSAVSTRALQVEAKIAENSARLRADVLGLRRFEKDIFINIDSKEKVAEYATKWKDQLSHAQARIADLERITVSQQDKEVVKVMKGNLEAYNAGFNKVFASVQSNAITTTQQGNQAINQYKNEIHGLEKVAQDFAAGGVNRMAEEGRTLQGSAVKVTVAMLCLILSSVVILAVAVFSLK